MKKGLFYAIIALCSVCSISSCSSGSDAKKAQDVSEHFWRLSYLNHFDSLEILYPNLNRLNINKSELVCYTFNTIDVIDLGEQRYEVRTMLNPGEEGSLIQTLFVKPDNTGSYIIYDSRGLKNHKKAERQDLIKYGVVEDGDVYVQKTDQERCYALDSVIPKIQEQIIDTVSEVIKKNVKVSVFEEYNHRGFMYISNNTSYDLSGIALMWNIKCDKWVFGVPLDEIHTAETGWSMKSFKPNTKQRIEEPYRSVISIVSPVRLKNKRDALKLWKYSGNEYDEWLAAHPEDKPSL